MDQSMPMQARTSWTPAVLLTWCKTPRSQIPANESSTQKMTSRFVTSAIRLLRIATW
jgi:hypothetical protein